MGNRPSGAETKSTLNVADQPGQGVHTLLHGTSTPPTTPPTESGPFAPKPKAPAQENNEPPFLPAWYLLGGDLLLTAMGVVLFMRTITTSTWGQRLFYIVLVLMGCALGIVGALIANSKPPKQ